MTEKDWRKEFDGYTKLEEPEKNRRSYAWKTAIGLQDVDSLQVSDYLLETAKEHIEGKIDIKTAGKRIEDYYSKAVASHSVQNSKEADLVSQRIAAVLGENSFQFSPVELSIIHKRLFDGLLDNAGTFRTYNIAKKEWVLNGETVIYSSFGSISDTLDYDFDREKKFTYKGLSMQQFVSHISAFTAGIWQIHPFCEGNTRATAVFVIKYLRTLGFVAENDIFAENSWYFRNALVRANYNDLRNNIHATDIYLERFFENLLCGTEHELKNRLLHVRNDTTGRKEQ